MENTNLSIKSNSELRAAARAQLKGKWGTAILLCIIYSAISGALGFIPIVGAIVTLVISGPFILGLFSCFIHLEREEPFIFENLFDGFKRFAPAFILQLLISIFTFLWSLLLIVPGIIAGLSYGMAFFILNDNPEMSAMDALKASKVMMQGHKGRLFLMGLFFCGLSILSVITLFIGLLWIIPYMYASLANFYQNLKDNQKTI